MSQKNASLMKCFLELNKTAEPIESSHTFNGQALEANELLGMAGHLQSSAPGRSGVVSNKLVMTQMGR